MLVSMWCLAALAAEPLTFDDAVRESLEHGVAAQIVDADRREEDANATALTSIANPTLGAERIVDETEVRVGVPVPIGGAPIAAHREATALRDAASVRGEAARATAGLEAGRAWLDARRADDLAALAEDARALAERRRDAGRRQSAAGEIGSVDAAAIDGDAAAAISDASVAESDAFRARLRLEVVLGRAPAGEVVVAPWPDLVVPGEVDVAALPEVVEAGDRARAAVAARSQARLAQIPTPIVTGGWRTGSVGAGPIVGLELELPVFSPGAARARAADAASDRAAAVARQTSLDAGARWLAEVHEAASAVAAWQEMDPKRLDDALAGLGVAIDAGALSIAEYAARRDAIVTGLKAAIEAHYRLEIARLDLWELSGTLPPEITP